MNMTAGLLALLMLGAPDGPPESAEVPVGYQIKVLEMKGLEWRGDLHDKLTPVARQGGATIWTASRDLLPLLTKESGQVVYSPKAATGQEVPAQIRNQLQRAIVANLKRVADGPFGQATRLSYQPEIDHVRESFSIAVRCRKLDQGVLARVVIDETRLASLYTYTIHESVRKGPDTEGKPAEITAQVHVPEIVSGKVDGEWLIPNDGILLIGLGVHTTASESKDSAVVERVAIIEARPSPTDIAVRQSAFGGFPMPPVPIGASALPGGEPFPIAYATPSVVSPAPTYIPPGALPFAAPEGAPLPPPLPVPAHVASAVVPARPMPDLPSRVLPTPINHKGEVVELPPLPDEPEVTDDESAEPRPAPQSSHIYHKMPSSVQPQSSPRSDDEETEDDAETVADEIPLQLSRVARPGEFAAPSRPHDRTTPCLHGAESESDALPTASTRGNPDGVICSSPTLARKGREAVALDFDVVVTANASKPATTRQAGSTCDTCDKASKPQATCPALSRVEPNAESHAAKSPRLLDHITKGLENFAHEGEETNGPTRIFDLKASNDRGEPVRLAVYIDANAEGRALLLAPLKPVSPKRTDTCDSCAASPAAPKVALAEATCCQEKDAAKKAQTGPKTNLHAASTTPAAAACCGAEKKASGVGCACCQGKSCCGKEGAPAESDCDSCDSKAKDEPACHDACKTTSTKCGSADACRDAEARELSLPEAIRLGLEDAEVVRVLAIGSGAIPSPITIGRVGNDPSLDPWKSDVSERVRAIEHAYRTVRQARAGLRSVESAVDLCESVLERGKETVEKNRGSVSNVAEATPKRDEATVQTSKEIRGTPGTRTITFSIGTQPTIPLIVVRPLRIRVPVGTVGSIEFRASKTVKPKD